MHNDQETSVMTKFGLTHTRVIEESIRQGRHLPRPELGLLINEINLELRTTDLGVQYGFIILIWVLFMDDIALLARSSKGLDETLNITSLFLNKWHLEVNIKKCSYGIRKISTKHIAINIKLELRN